MFVAHLFLLVCVTIVQNCLLVMWPETRHAQDEPAPETRTQPTIISACTQRKAALNCGVAAGRAAAAASAAVSAAASAASDSALAAVDTAKLSHSSTHTDTLLQYARSEMRTIKEDEGRVEAVVKVEDAEYSNENDASEQRGGGHEHHHLGTEVDLAEEEYEDRDYTDQKYSKDPFTQNVDWFMRRNGRASSDSMEVHDDGEGELWKYLEEGDPPEEEANGILFGKKMHVMEGLEEEEEQGDAVLGAWEEMVDKAAAIHHVVQQVVDQLVLRSLQQYHVELQHQLQVQVRDEVEYEDRDYTDEKYSRDPFTQNVDWFMRRNGRVASSDSMEVHDDGEGEVWKYLEEGETLLNLRRRRRRMGCCLGSKCTSWRDWRRRRSRRTQQYATSKSTL